MPALKSVSPQRAAEMLRDGAVLVDIREADEHARERIPGARHHALSTVDTTSPIRRGDDVVIFHCRSGARTVANAERLAQAAQCEAFVVEGGLDAWKRAGLPVALDRGKPIELMRQVQIGAGSLLLLGTALGFVLAPEFHLLAAAVGVGLTLAGITGVCGLTRLLALMPWNRRSAALS
jgi:rhodanese-related sulfurtransferase